MLDCVSETREREVETRKDTNIAFSQEQECEHEHENGHKYGANVDSEITCITSNGGTLCITTSIIPQGEEAWQSTGWAFNGFLLRQLELVVTRCIYVVLLIYCSFVGHRLLLILMVFVLPSDLR